ncbi:MAG TPA: class I SAM-dependent methyltransferase [Acidimicrobiales bacterium]|nr:class I SAM-dependent methyltransferase [Acidimicrobiales bacterium]
MTTRSLQQLYEDPATPLVSGSGRARLQAQMLVDGALGAHRALRAVDVGCGTGTWTALAADVAARAGIDMTIIGLDWSVAALRQARGHGLEVVRGSVEHPGLPLGSATVDIVIISELIEHLVDTDTALAEVRRVLVPGGRLLLSTPNLAAWYNRGLLFCGVQPIFTEVSLRGIYGRPGHEVVGHLRVFTRRALAALLHAHGFVDVAITGAPYHDVPRPLRPIDRLLCKVPSLSSILLASAEAP